MGQAESKQEMFWEACGFGRAHLVQKFIEHGIDVNWVSSIHDCSPIHVASQGKADVVKLLIDAGCDINVVDSRGNTSIHHAAMQGHSDIIQMLADAGADLNAQDKNGWTALHHAAYYAHLRAVEVLIANNCDINILNKDGRSALIETARSRKYSEEQVLGEIARSLIKAGCDVNLKCTDLGEANFTGLMFAAYHNHDDVATALIDGNCDLDMTTLYTKWTALHWAADCNNDDLVYLLLDAGANPICMGMRGELASDRAKDPELKTWLENAEKEWKENGINGHDESATKFSAVHSVNAQASLDTAKALESLSTQAKNRDILSTPMPTMPVLGITSRSDPKSRYARRSVKEVAAQSIKTNFPWKSYSKQTSPSPDREYIGENGQVVAGEERQKMFPSQDDKTNRFMDSLAQRINYMTGMIASMGGEPSSNGRRSSSTAMKPSALDERSSSETTITPGSSTEPKDDLQDSGLSSPAGSRVPSELTTPDNDGSAAITGGAALTSKSSPSKSPKSPSSPLKAGDSMLDAEADAGIIEESHRGLTILKALQERRRRSLVMDDAEADALLGPSPASSTTTSHQSASDHLRFLSEFGSSNSRSSSQIHINTAGTGSMPVAPVSPKRDGIMTTV